MPIDGAFNNLWKYLRYSRAFVFTIYRYMNIGVLEIVRWITKYVDVKCIQNIYYICSCIISIICSVSLGRVWRKDLINKLSPILPEKFCKLLRSILLLLIIPYFLIWRPHWRGLFNREKFFLTDGKIFRSGDLSCAVYGNCANGIL